MIRPRRVAAIAWRDLRGELKGRQGLFVPAVLVALMLPTSMYKPEVSTPGFIDVVGEVPDDVLALPRIRRRETEYANHFSTLDDGTLEVTGINLDEGIRRVLDEQLPQGRVEVAWRLPARQAPHRGLLLALLAASSLTGPVSSAIGTERSRGTLTALLTAAVTRAEIVVGKWLAWGGFGLASTLAFTAVALWRDVVDPGMWLLSMSTVPLALTAFSLWVVRRASDVVGATATALRLQPAALMVSALTAWVLGDVNPVLGALVPLGGALLSAGDVWTEYTTLAPLLATGSTLTACAFFLFATARDLEEHASNPPLAAGWTGAAVAAGAGALALWSPIIGPELWRQAGNPGLTERLSIDVAALGAAAALGGWATLRALQHPGGPPLVDVRSPRPATWGLAAVAGVVLGLAVGGFGAMTDPTSMLGAISLRLQLTMIPTGVALPTATALIVTEELLFRGILARQTGVVPASTAWAVVKAPLDPFGAVVSGLLMGSISGAGGLLPSLACRWVALATATAVTLPPLVAIVTGLVGATLVAAAGRALTRGGRSTT